MDPHLGKLFVCLSICLSIAMFVHQSLCSLLCLLVHLSIALFLCPISFESILLHDYMQLLIKNNYAHL